MIYSPASSLYDQSRVWVARDIDPAFHRAFREARAAGVETRAYRCDVGPEGVTIAGEIPILTPE